MKPYKINAVRTHVLYIIILIKHNMQQLLMFTKWHLQQKPVLYCLKEQNRYWSDNKYV